MITLNNLENNDSGRHPSNDISARNVQWTMTEDELSDGLFMREHRLYDSDLWEESTNQNLSV